ncbi:hypothetical protein WJX74_009961 [Apatococcus lobatus]|uniref:Uncharacterized protein n=1 Tax=Apatococcus lobatus TaxID=904363 RepID=A0AAW1S2Q8_9CHLO
MWLSVLPAKVLVGVPGSYPTASPPRHFYPSSPRQPHPPPAPPPSSPLDIGAVVPPVFVAGGGWPPQPPPHGRSKPWRTTGGPPPPPSSGPPLPRRLLWRVLRDLCRPHTRPPPSWSGFGGCGGALRDPKLGGHYWGRAGVSVGRCGAAVP